MNTVLVTCGLSDEKLRGKLAGLISHSWVDQIILVRKTPFEADKVVNVTPPAWIVRSRLLFEFWRLFYVFFYGISRNVCLFVGIQAQMHGVVAVFAGLLLGSKSVLWLIGSDLFIHSKNGFFAPLIRFSIRKSHTVFVMGEFSRRLVEEVCGRRCRVLIQQVVCDEGLSNEENFCKKKWELLFAGNLVDVKDPLLAVSVFARIHELMPESRFCMIGDGDLKDEILARISEKGLRNHVDLLGHVKDPLAYMQASKLLIIPSKSEGLPSVLIEASKLGVPVVASSVGEITDIASTNNGVVGAKSGDIESFVQPILEMLTNESLYRLAAESAMDFGIQHCRYWSVGGQSGIWEKAFP